MDHLDADLEEIRRFWDDDSATYDRSPGHRPVDPAVRRAWAGALAGLLPSPPADILDLGAGTGFLSMIAARAGHRVTALDLSPSMLGQLQRSAADEGASVATVAGSAQEVLSGHFDAAMERHLLWTLPDPAGALANWRAAADRLVLIESLWGDTRPRAKARAGLRRQLRRLRGTPPDHHSEYPPALRRALPLGTGTPPDTVLSLVAAAGWPSPKLVWLDELARAEHRALPPPERLVGLPPRFAVIAG